MKWEYGIAVMAAWNIAVFALYGIDKWKAKHQRWRVSESALLLCAIFLEVLWGRWSEWKFSGTRRKNGNFGFSYRYF